LEETDRVLEELKERNEELQQTQKAQQAKLLEHEKREQELAHSTHQKRWSNQFPPNLHQANTEAMLARDEEYDDFEEIERQDIKV
jgi:hypothetical protein